MASGDAPMADEKSRTMSELERRVWVRVDQEIWRPGITARRIVASTVDEVLVALKEMCKGSEGPDSQIYECAVPEWLEGLRPVIEPVLALEDVGELIRRAYEQEASSAWRMGIDPEPVPEDVGAVIAEMVERAKEFEAQAHRMRRFMDGGAEIQERTESDARARLNQDAFGGEGDE